MSLLKQCLISVPEHRRAQARQYDLVHVLLFCILALASGANSLRRMSKFMNKRLGTLRAVFGCQWRQAPTHTGLYTILQGVDPGALERALREHSQRLHARTAGEFVALDGKWLRGSLEQLQDRHAAQVLSVLAVEAAVVLGEIVIEHEDKAHEIEAVQRVIEELGLSGKVFTLDALHLQKKTVEAVVASGNDLIVQCKANQPGLLEAVRIATLSEPEQARYTETERGHGRYELRQVRLFTLPDGFGQDPWHRHFRLAIEVTRHTQERDRSPSGWQRRRFETSYYLATHAFSAETAAQAIRQHWHIENRLHHVLDVSFEEDRNRTHRKPGLLARLRRTALNILRFNDESNIRDALYENALDIDKVLAYKGI